MTGHRFLVGQQVLLDHVGLTRAAGPVEITRQAPSDVDGAPQYRVRSASETFDRMVKEHQLTAVAAPVAAGSS